MAKVDRIPDQWPLLMSDEMSARYLDISLTLFRAWVETGHLPVGRRLFGSAVVRWYREMIDAVMSREFGRPIANSEVVSLLDGEEAWERALNAA
jgi:predicted DNA-binding transcriptional regulator AlpA